MGLTIGLFGFILLVAILVDFRVLIQDGSIKVWVLYSGLTGIGIALMIVSLAIGHDINVFEPIERVVHPVSRWMFQTS